VEVGREREQQSWVSSTTSAMRESGCRPCDTIDDGQVRGKGLAQHESRLGSGPSEASTSSTTRDFDIFRAQPRHEVGVARGVDHVDRHARQDRGVPWCSDRGVFARIRDALFAFEVTRIHGTIGDMGVLAVGAALHQQRHEGCLPWSRGRRLATLRSQIRRACEESFHIGPGPKRDHLSILRTQSRARASARVASLEAQHIAHLLHPERGLGLWSNTPQGCRPQTNRGAATTRRAGRSAADSLAAWSKNPTRQLQTTGLT